jgi:hypothetical protein
MYLKFMGFLAHIFVFLITKPILAISLLVIIYLLIDGFFKI